MGNFIQVMKGMNQFFNSIADSYVSGNVPIDAKYPYLTYSVETSSFDVEGNFTVRVWTRSESYLKMAELSSKVEEKVEDGILPLPDGGYFYIYKGDPFIQITPDEDPLIKSALININYRMYQ